MDKISNDRGVNSQYNFISAQSNKSPNMAFGDLLATAVNKPIVASTLTAVSTVANPNFKDTLSAALQAYGINVPPALRITSDKDGFALSGDNRNVKFQTMLNENPALRDGMANMINSAASARKEALKGAMADFAGSNPSASVSDFLDQFELAQKDKEISIKFNGADMHVEEKSDKGWIPVKDKANFTMELLDAYAKYMVKHAVTSESDKDDPYADLELKKNMAKAATEV
ncbi:MAG: hypothetical protein Q7T66_02750 [Herminiimonas sp.]|uniref:hypothetical protein n=1 Tax=Herminiimonas sp. TaxID=1926289 RepID=UPI002718BF6A|nr:hypothetical protein [Herminiimonas sp.]MDO9419561.1 hypothetical protein [Herminiimonas sp.]